MAEANGNNQANVSSAKGVKGGYIFSAPEGTALPTDIKTPLDPAFKCLGFISEDGYVETVDEDSDDITDMNGDIMDSTNSNRVESAQFTLAEIKAETLIIATGASAKYLGLPSETKFRGMGVSACATCDGFFYRKKDVAVVGGGDTACEEATYLASICRKVYMIVRKPHLRASKAMQERVFNTTNIEVMFNHNTAEVLGDESGVTGALLRCNDGKEVRIDIAGFFLAIGHHPNTELFADQLTLDAEGYIKTEAGTSKTNIEGVFAAGDVRDPHYRQAITAAASGCIAAIDCERFILNRAE